MFGSVDRLDIRVDLSKPIRVFPLPYTFSDDEKGTTLKLLLYDERDPYSVDGMIANLYAIRADGATVTMVGTVDDNTITFDLSGLTVPGRVEFRCELVSGDIRKTVWAAEGTVLRTYSDAVATVAGESLSTVLAAIERLENVNNTAVQGLLDSYSDLPTNPDYVGIVYGVADSSAASGYTYYIYDGETSSWKSLGDIYAATESVEDFTDSITYSVDMASQSATKCGKTVCLSMRTATGSSWSAGDTLMTIPSGYRPSSGLAFTAGAVTSGSTGYAADIRISGGTVSIVRIGASSGFITFSITYHVS